MIILPLLWFYAFITGMPPSVTRAVSMITLWGIGNAFFFRALTINTLGFSAFFILIYNPFNLYHIGFQLSFSAVLAILLINPYLTSLYQAKNPVIKYFWELSCVSTSAQLGTIPFSLYYFNQFPLLFLISNMIVLPLTGVLLLLVPLSLTITIPFGNLPELLFPLRILIQTILNVLSVISEIPNGVIRDIQLTLYEAIFIALGIIFLLLAVIKKRVIYICLFIILVALQVL